MSFKLSDQATSFVRETLADAGQSTALDARAGSGKTTSLVALSQRLKSTVLATSYSRAIVDELGSRMPRSVVTMGIHQMGYQAIRTKLQGIELRPIKHDNELTEKAVAATGGNNDAARNLKKLVELGQLQGWAPTWERSMGGDTDDEWMELAAAHQIDWYEGMDEHARALLIWINDRAFRNRKAPVMNFAHMLSGPLLLNLRLQQFRTVIVDEAQDLSPLQHRIIHRVRFAKGRCVVAGDPYQAIYAFAGAMSDSYEKLQAAVGAKPYPLTITWRCARSIVEYAQMYVPDLRAAPGAMEGMVDRPATLPLDEVPDVVLCRNNAPLVRLGMRLFRAGRPVLIRGRDVGVRMDGITRRLSEDNNRMSTSKLIEKLDDMEAEIRSDSSRTAPRYLLDYIEALRSVCSFHTSVGEVRGHLSAMFNLKGKSDRLLPGTILLSTIHRAKGLEWDDVLLLDPFRLNAANEEAPEWLRKQERNLAYVGVTRARKSLTLIDERSIC